MNKFKGTIKDISENSALNFITVDVNSTDIFALTLELNENFKTGAEVNLFFKETEIILSKTSESIIGSENIIHSEIMTVEKGEIFSEILCGSSAGNFKAISTNVSVDKNLLPGTKVYALIKASAITLGLQTRNEP